MKKVYVKQLFPLFLLLLWIGVIPFRACASPAKSGSKPLYFAGGNFLYSRRNGVYLFDAVKKQQDITLPNLSLFGFTLGRRYYTTPWLRFELDCMLNFGSILGDELYYGDYFTQKFRYKNFSGIIDMHLVRPRSTKLDLFVFAGGGINYVNLEEQAVNSDDTSIELNLSGYNGIAIKRWSPGVRFGAGIDITPAKNLGFSLSYAYQVWRPVQYLDQRDMPVKAVAYKEHFLTHMFQIKFLFNFI